MGLAPRKALKAEEKRIEWGRDFGAWVAALALGAWVQRRPKKGRTQVH